MNSTRETKGQLPKWYPILVLAGGTSVGLIVSLLSRESLLPAGMIVILLDSILIFGLMLKYFRLSLLVIFFIVPFYYFPFYLSSLGWLGILDYSFWFRAGKDVLVLCIVGVWFLRLLLSGRSKIKISIVSAGLVGYIFFGLFRGAASLGSGLITTFRIYLEFTIFFFASRDVFSSESHINSLIKLWVLSSIGVSSLGIIEYFIGGQTVFSRAAGQIRIISTLYNPNALGWYLTWANGLIVGLYMTRSCRKERQVLLFSFGLNSSAILLSGSRGSLLASVFTLFAAVILRPRIRKSVLVSSLLVAGISLVVLTLISFDIDSLRVFRFENAAGPRIERILETRSDIFNSPWEIIWGRDDIGGRGGSKNISVDSAYINLLYSGGLISIFLLGVVLLGFGLDLKRLYVRSHKFALALILSSISLLFIGIFGDFLRAFPTAMFFWSSAGITNYLANKTTDPLKD